MKQDKDFLDILKIIGNQILFGNFEKTEFLDGKLQLSIDFINIFIKNQNVSDSLILECYLNDKIIISLNNLDKRDRLILIQNILKDENYFEGMILINLMLKKKFSIQDIDIVKRHFDIEINLFLENGNISNLVITFFKLIFGELFYLEFLESGYISEIEYSNFFTNFTNVKSIIN